MPALASADRDLADAPVEFLDDIAGGAASGDCPANAGLGAQQVWRRVGEVQEERPRAVLRNEL